MKIYKIRKEEPATKYWVDVYIDNDNSVDKKTVAMFHSEYEANMFIEGQRVIGKLKDDIASGKLKKEDLPELPF